MNKQSKQTEPSKKLKFNNKFIFEILLISIVSGIITMLMIEKEELRVRLKESEAYSKQKNEKIVETKNPFNEPLIYYVSHSLFVKPDPVEKSDVIELFKKNGLNLTLKIMPPSDFEKSEEILSKSIASVYPYSTRVVKNRLWYIMNKSLGEEEDTCHLEFGVIVNKNNGDANLSNLSSFPIIAKKSYTIKFYAMGKGVDMDKIENVDSDVKRLESVKNDTRNVLIQGFMSFYKSGKLSSSLGQYENIGSFEKSESVKFLDISKLNFPCTVLTGGRDWSEEQESYFLANFSKTFKNATPQQKVLLEKVLGISMLKFLSYRESIDFQKEIFSTRKD